MTTATMEQQAIDISKLSDEQVQNLLTTAQRIHKQRKNVATLRYVSENGIVTAPENVELYVKLGNKYVLLEGGQPVATRAKNRSSVVAISPAALAEASNGSEPEDEDYEDEDEDEEE